MSRDQKEARARSHLARASGTDLRNRPGTRAETPSEAPEPTHTEARDRRPEEADTKVERRASVRPSAFGVPRKSQPPPAPEPNPAIFSTPEEPRREPHERVLEAARLLDAVFYARTEAQAVAASARPDSEVLLARGPARFDARLELDASDDIQRLPNQRARGVEHLVARGSAETGPVRKTSGQSAAPAAGGVAKTQPSARPAGSAQVGTAATPAGGSRSARRPWLSLLLFGGMVALSVVPLLRYAQSAEDKTSSAHRPLVSAAGLNQVRAAAVSSLPPAIQAEPAPPPSRTATRAPEESSEREPLIAGLLSEGTRALEANDIREAEHLFARVLELAADNPHAAYGLARVRLIQNNLSGAEGWIQLALRKRPRRAAYHALYADVLSRMGRMSAARAEQTRAGVGRDNEELEP